MDRASIIGLIHDAGFIGLQARSVTVSIAVACLDYRR
jgi:hypothetical protein